MFPCWIILTKNQLLLQKQSHARHGKKFGSIHNSLRLGGISNKMFGLSEGNIRRGGTVSLVIGNDLNMIVLPNSNSQE
jgi:hypothetical protein